MDSKPAQNIQDTFLNTVRKDKSPITIYLVSGVKLTGKIRSFDKYSVLLENNAQEQLIFKHAISTVVSGRPPASAKRAASPSCRNSSRRDSAASHGSGQQLVDLPPRGDICSREYQGNVPNRPASKAKANAKRSSRRCCDSAREPRASCAVLVAVEFTADRPPSPAAQQARAAAAISERDTASARPTSMSRTRFQLHPSPPPVDLDFDASLAEFQELARSAGATIAAVLIQRAAKPDAATLVGGGKLDEIVATVASTGASLVLFDHDLTPSQARNIEARLPCTVIDRTQLILDIFARHARTREGSCRWSSRSLNINCRASPAKARPCRSSAAASEPAVRAKPSSKPIAAGSTSRLDRIKQQLEAVRRIRRQQRGRREAVPVPTVALVGYTNAGKSLCSTRLTGAEALASERMFATLDPKLRQLTLPSRRKVLLSDTVGFHPQSAARAGNQLPRDARRGRARRASAACSRRCQPHAGRAGVAGGSGSARVGCEDKPTLQVLNKIDLLPAGTGFSRCAGQGTIAVSGLTGQGLDELLHAIDAALTPIRSSRGRVPHSAGRGSGAGRAGTWSDDYRPALRGQPGVSARGRAELAVERYGGISTATGS